jgi:hypothetical protein
MLLSVPDAASRGTPEDTSTEGSCPLTPQVTTSCEDEYDHNFMGQAPPGFKPSPAVNKFGNPSGVKNGSPLNGVDFWWDEFTGNTGNCWYQNQGPDGTRDSLTADPPLNPSEGESVPGFLPENCATSMGTANGYSNKAPILLACFGQWETGNLDAPGCGWWDTPPQPGSAAAASQRSPEEALAPSPALREWVYDLAGEISYGP